jgi:paraquat-inducible protein A
MLLGGRRFLLASAVAAASVCLGLGISLPFVRLTKFMLYTYEHSLIALVSVLMRSGQLLLGAAVLVFALFVPVLRLLYLLLLSLLPLRDIDRLARPLGALEWLGRWSIWDLVALALTIALVQTQSAYEAANAGGIHAFAGGVLLVLVAYAWQRGDVAAARMHVPVTKVAHSSAVRGLVFTVLVLLAAALLVLGLTLPAIRLPATWAGSDQHSAVSLLRALYGEGQHFAWVALAALTVLLPGLKLLYLVGLLAARMLPYGLRARSMRAVEWLGGYPISEIPVLALMVFYLGATDRSGVLILPGTYCFAASALLTLAAFGWANAPGRAGAGGRQRTLADRLAGVATREG